MASVGKSGQAEWEAGRLRWFAGPTVFKQKESEEGEPEGGGKEELGDEPSPVGEQRKAKDWGARLVLPYEALQGWFLFFQFWAIYEYLLMNTYNFNKAKLILYLI